MGPKLTVRVTSWFPQHHSIHAGGVDYLIVRGEILVEQARSRLDAFVGFRRVAALEQHSDSRPSSFELRDHFLLDFCAGDLARIELKVSGCPGSLGKVVQREVVEGGSSMLVVPDKDGLARTGVRGNECQDI